MTDFQVTKQLKLEELHCTLQQLVHVPTGACVLHIANDDPENLFCLSFQTLPDSSNGVAHILAHTVLCGSKKFPIKDPFFSMTRRSLHTFMNAMTGQDFTCYPASSQVEKDFYNLLEVYLDAVFYPELKQLSFLQEGHRLELHDHQLQIQGVVYNEMKGAMSSAESRLWEALAKALMPDLPYAHNSGGNPREIPNLTYEELLAFHRNFYHPSRCLFFFYGNLPLEKHLKFIEDKALRHVSKMAPLPPLPRQRRFSQPVQTRAYYPIASGESKGGKCEIAFAWLTVPLSDQEKALALSLLDLLLLDTDASPLKMALLRSGLCSEVEASMDLEMSEIPWVIICKGCDPEDAEPLKKILFDTLQKICQKPFETKHVEACLHQLEFDRTEIGGEGSPFGLTLFFRAALLHQHGNDPENALLIHSLFKQLRERLLNPNYLTDLLRATLLENSHFVQLTLEPDNELEKRELEEEQTRLKQREKTLTPKEKEEIQKKMQALSRYQEEVEHQSLDCLPKLQLADVPSVTRDFPLGQNKCDELEIFHHNCFTNHITYADLLFDLPDLSASDLPLVFLFSKLLTEVGCGGREYGENLEFQQAYTGGFQCLMSLHVLQEDPNRCKPSLSIRGKALQHNVPQLFQLFGDVVSSADFTDEKRIRSF
ncbi:MAG: insulinase family protein [Chlamydiia bacterium]|nr:insulinase family protein [Chlamydiia bacterium]